MDSSLLIGEMFGGKFGEVAALFIALLPSISIIGVFIVVIRFVTLVIKKEVNTIEDILGFAWTKGGRFLLITLMWVPASGTGIESLQLKGSSGTIECPLGISLLYAGAKAGFGSADQLSNSAYGIPMLQLPSVFTKVSDQRSKELNTTYQSVMIDKDLVTGEQRDVYDKSGWGSALKVAVAVTGFLIPFLGVNLGYNNLSQILKDGAITGDNSLVAKIRDWLVSILIPAAVIIAFYTSIAVVLIKYVIYGPFFMISAALLYFDSKKQHFYDNLIKVIGLILSPVGIVISFIVCANTYSLFTTVLERYMFASMRAADTGVITHLFVTLGAAGVFMGVCVKIFNTMDNLISTLIGASFSIGLK